MKFTMENEIDNTNNFLDITIQKGIENLSFDIYRKPITTDILYQAIPVTHLNISMPPYDTWSIE
jgi:hypothetical protein